MKKDKSAQKAKADATGSQPEAAENEYRIAQCELNELRTALKKFDAIGNFLACLTPDDIGVRGIERFPMEIGIMLQSEALLMDSILEDVEKEGGQS